MSKVNFTEEQQKVIDLRGANILVSAAAGSGKTAVLTERIVSLITGNAGEESGIDIDKMLILTYTSAAAAEMRERIGKKISDALAANPLDENLWRQQTLLLSAKISTIDSFCLFVIRNNFADIDLDPGFRIMDEGERKLLLSDTIDALFEKHFEDESDSDFRHLIDCYGSTADNVTLANILKDMYGAIMSNPDPIGWLDDMALQSYRISDIDELQDTFLWKCSENYREGLIGNMVRYADLAVMLCESEGGPAKYLPTMQDYQHIAHCLKDEKGYERRYKLVNNSEITKLSSAKAPGEEPEKREQAKKYRDIMAGILENLKSFYGVQSDIASADGQYILRLATTLVDLLKELIVSFANAKKENNILDFNDMEHYAYKILVREVVDGQVIPTESAKEYRDYFEVVMVDEYQDSNYVQEHILRSIARDNNYFMVGDVKQSIYKFRQACPDIFVNKYNSYKSEGVNVRIDLNKNFRSRQEVLDFANVVFENTMHTDTASIQYDDKARLYLGNTNYLEGTGYEAQVLILDGATKKESDLLDTASHEAEALLVASKIKELIGQGLMVEATKESEGRPVTYSDIVILLRSTKGWDQVFKDALESQGIPAYINLKTGYFSTNEVSTLLEFLKVVDNPCQDIPLYGSLVSFFGGLRPEEVASIKARYIDKTLYEAAAAYIEAARDAHSESENESENKSEDESKNKNENESGNNKIQVSVSIADRLDSFFQMVRDYRHKSTYMQVRELVESIMLETGYLDYITAMPDGDRRRANVLMLLERASGFEQSSYHGLFHFNRYIAQLRESEVDYGEAGMAVAGEDAVRIMSIHSSKGLEFPVCFFSGAGKNMNMSDSNSSVLFDREVGLAFDYINPDTCEKRKSLQKGLVSRKIRLDSIAEEIRVLYVALTRAKEKMIVTGEVNDYEKMILGLKGKGEYMDADILGAKSLLDIIIYGLANQGVVAQYIKGVTYEDITTDYVKSELIRQQHLSTLANRDYLVDEDISKVLADKAEFIYPYEHLKGLAIKTSVSELKHAAMHEAFEESDQLITHFETDEVKAYVPEFISGEVKSNQGALRGSAVHRLMELLPFKDMICDADFIHRTITRELESGRFTEEFADLIPVKKCVQFLGSSLAKRMSVADSQGKLHKEQSFFLGVPASRVKEEYPESEIMLIQGIIDAYFEEDDYIVLMDYKTDAVENPDVLVSRYSRQLELYQEALERITGKKVKEKIIYSFAFGSEINL